MLHFFKICTSVAQGILKRNGKRSSFSGLSSKLSHNRSVANGILFSLIDRLYLSRKIK
jgi:hypothetical protein